MSSPRDLSTGRSRPFLIALLGDLLLRPARR